MTNESIIKSILSISSPGVSPDRFNGPLSVKLARQCNDYAGQLKKSHPDKFGFWASLPLPIVSASLKEIDHVFDCLGAEGIVLLSNYHGHYLGCEEFKPIFDELNRRKAIVFIHPGTPCIAAPTTNPASVIDALPLADFYPSPMFEFFFDSARAVTNLFLTRTIFHYPDIQYIVSHGGGVLPPLIDRCTRFNQITGEPQDPSDPDANPITTELIKKTLNKQFFFDLAGYPFPYQIHGLLMFVDYSRLLYGSDYSFTPDAVMSELVNEMEKGMKDLWGDNTEGEKKRKAVWEGNARKLLGL